MTARCVVWPGGAAVGLGQGEQSATGGSAPVGIPGVVVGIDDVVDVAAAGVVVALSVIYVALGDAAVAPHCLQAWSWQCCRCTAWENSCWDC